MSSVIPAFRSLFGGLWSDINNANEVIDGKLSLGYISAEQADQLKFWVENGYLIIKNAVPSELIDEVNSDIDLAWNGGMPSLWVEHWANQLYNFDPVRKELREKPHKLLDLYSESESTRKAIFSKPILDFLTLIFDRKPMAFQSLSFWWGSRQPIHQDSAYVICDSPMEFVASWIALEDIHPDSGALEYYEGSHRMKEFLFQGSSKGMPPGDPDGKRFLDSIHEQAEVMGLKRKKLLINKGDALIWSADLAHGGSQNVTPGISRRSHVTHYCPVSNRPQYFGKNHDDAPIKHDQNSYYCYQARK
jgi:phytanoyl-CoA hydroxylase